jgi:hypothetical protein
MKEAGRLPGKAGRRRHETRALLRVHCTHQCRAARLQMPPIAQHRVTRQTSFGCDVQCRAVKGGEERGAVRMKPRRCCVPGKNAGWCSCLRHLLSKSSGVRDEIGGVLQFNKY